MSDRIYIETTIVSYLTGRASRDVVIAGHQQCRKGLQGPDHLYARRTFGSKAMNDPFVDEIPKIRDAHAARFNYDLAAIYRDIKEREKERERTTGRKFIPPPRRAGPTSADAASPPAPLLPASTPLPERSRANER